MFAREGLIALASTALAGLGIAALAAPAHADAAVTVGGNLTFNGALDEWEGASFDPGAVEGPTVTISFVATGLDRDAIWVAAGGMLTKTNGTVCDYTECEMAVNSSETFIIDPDASNSEISFYEAESYVIDGSFTVTYAPPGDDPGGSAPGPAPLMQQFPRPATGTCDEAQPEGLNWSGVGSGGWGESWAQWMNDGEGGDVCTRTLIYNASASAWEVD